jgi:hypothetical protein
MVSPGREPGVSAQPESSKANVSYWRRSRNGTPLSTAQADRQGKITTLAFLALGRDRALTFLNEDHAGLGGRPLAIAIESDAGRDLVEAEIGRQL